MATDTRFIKVGGEFQRPAPEGYWTDGNIVNGVNVGGGKFVQGTPPPSTQARTLDMGTTTGQAGTTLPTAPGSAPAPSSVPPAAVDSFNNLLSSLLKGAQGVSTVDFLARKRALERASIGKTAEITPEDQRTLSPGQQDAIRTGEVSALRPEIDHNAYELEKAQQSIDNFFKVFGEAKKFGQEFTDKMVAPDSVIENARKVIEANPDNLSTVLAGFNDKTKEKILGSLDYTKIKSKPISVTAGSSVFDPVTGKFLGTAPEKGGGTSSTGTYVPGADLNVDGWATRIQNGTAKFTDIPASQVGLRNSVNVALTAMGNSSEGKPTATELGKAALSTAKDLVSKFKNRLGTSVVGRSRLFGGGIATPGSDSANFINDFKSLKSQLALEGVKYLKGQGAVSDSERALLTQAVTKLDLSQSEDEFKKTLDDIVTRLEGGSTGSSASSPKGSDDALLGKYGL